MQDFDLVNMPDNESITITKAGLIELLATSNLCFIEDCMKMATENLVEAEVRDLQRLFDKVTSGEPFADPPEEE